MTTELATKERLNTCLDILDSTDLGQSLVWLWCWSVIKSIIKDSDEVNYSENQIWEMFYLAVNNGQSFSLEFGDEHLYEWIRDWMSLEGILGEVEE